MIKKSLKIDNIEPERRIMPRILLLTFFTLAANLIFSQDIKGKILSDKGIAIPEVRIFNKLNGSEYYSNSDGSFSIPNSTSTYDLLIIKDSYIHLNIDGNVVDIPQDGLLIKMKSMISNNDDLGNESVSEGEDGEGSNGDVYSLLSSARDPLLQAAAFNFGNFRFNLRGLDYKWNTLSLNGFVLNDLEIGGTPFYLASGQNKLTQYADNHLGVANMNQVYGSFALNQNFDIDASTYRKGLNLYYSNSNRAYTNRLGLHYANKFKHNFSLVAGVNRRWANSGAYPGTFYDANGMYLGLTKIVNSKLSLRLMGVYAPNFRGKRGAVTKEVYALAGDNLYNPYWGYQLGKVRNSRTNRTQIPVGTFNLNYRINDYVNLSSGVLFLKGKRADGSLDWADTNDPRPDYYQKLPSYIQNKENAASVAEKWKSDENISQVNWESFYQANYNNVQSIINANGIQGNTVTGKRSVYVLIDRHADPTEFEHFSGLNFSIKKWKANVTYRYEYSKKQNYNKLSDLLGGDYLVDQLDFVDDPNQANPDLDSPNKIIKVGDKFGLNYSSNQQKIGISTEWFRAFKKFDAFWGLNTSKQYSQRNGIWKNILFANSQGKSENVSSNNFEFKLGANYKINGRNYLQAVASYHNLSPNFSQIFANPDQSNTLLDSWQNSKINNTSINYYYRSPELKIGLGAYFIQLRDLTINKKFFLDSEAESASNKELADGGLINAFYTNWDQQNMGIEGSIELALGRGLSFTGVVSAGDYKNISRPILKVFDKFSTATAAHTIYLKEYYIPNTPQFVSSAGLKYELRRNGFLTLTLSYIDENYVEPNSLRRTVVGVKGVDRNSELYSKIISQEKLPSAISLDFFAFKSFYIYKKYTAISLGVNNILNSKNLISGGFEQTRFDFTDKNVDRFPNKYFYLQGINYYLNFSISF